MSDLGIITVHLVSAEELAEAQQAASDAQHEIGMLAADIAKVRHDRDYWMRRAIAAERRLAQVEKENAQAAAPGHFFPFKKD